MKKILCLVLPLLFAGCASHTGVVSIGKDTFMIAKQQATGFPGLGNLKAEIISEGSAYCKERNKEFQLVSTSESQPPYIMGNYPRSEITFMCISISDPELQRPRLQKNPDTIIQIQKQ